jgi:hypothetical protein
MGIFVSDVGGLTGWQYVGAALAPNGSTSWDGGGAGTPAAIVTEDMAGTRRVLLGYSGRSLKNAAVKSLMVAVAAHPRGPFQRPSAPVRAASMYPGKEKSGDEDGPIFWRRPGDPPSHMTLMFETKAAPPESRLPCGHHKIQHYTYCTRAVRTTDGGGAWSGGEVLLGRQGLMEPLAAAWFGERLVYITDNRGGAPVPGHPWSTYLDAYLSADGRTFVEAEPFAIEGYQPLTHKVDSPAPRSLVECPLQATSCCEQPCMTFIVDERDKPVAISFVRNDNATGLDGGYTNYVYEFTAGPPPPPLPPPTPPPPRIYSNATEVFTPGEGGYPCIRIPSIILAGDNRTLNAFAECRRFTGDGCNPLFFNSTVGAARDICQKQSTDGGIHWNALKVIVPGPAAQGTPVYDAETNRLLLQWVQLEPPDTRQMVSSNHGATWSKWRSVCGAHSLRNRSCGGAVGPGTGIQLAHPGPHRGRLLFIGHYSCPCGKTCSGSWAGYGHATVWYSDDNGATYSAAAGCLGKMDESQLVELPSGDVLANMRHQTEGSRGRGISRSTDSGATWGAVSFDKTLIGPNCAGSIMRLNEQVFFANPGSSKTRTNGVIRRSPDGVHWNHTEQQVFAGAFGYSCLTRVPQGDRAIGLLWESDGPQCKENPKKVDPSCRILFSSFLAEFGLKMDDDEPATADAAALQPINVFPAGMLGYDSFRGPLLLHLPRDRLVTFAAGRAPGGTDTSGRSILKRCSTDHGRSFGPPVEVVPRVSNATLAAGGGVITGITVFDSVVGAAFLLWVMCDERCRPDRPAGLKDLSFPSYMLTTSTDGFESWSHRNLTREYEAAHRSMENATRFFPYLMSSSHGLELAQSPHTLLMCGGRFSWDPEPKHSVGAACLRSTDHGVGWQAGTSVPIVGRAGHCTGGEHYLDAGEVQVAALRNGSILMQSQANYPTGCNNGGRLLARSDDRGWVWSKPRLMPMLDNGVQGSMVAHDDVLYISHGAHAPCWTKPDHHACRRNMTIAVSRNFGSTWSQLPIFSGFSGYSNLVHLGQEVLGLAFETGIRGPEESIAFVRVPTALLQRLKTDDIPPRPTPVVVMEANETALFVDDLIIESTSSLTRTLNSPDTSFAAIRPDAKWERGYAIGIIGTSVVLIEDEAVGKQIIRVYYTLRNASLGCGSGDQQPCPKHPDSWTPAEPNFEHSAGLIMTAVAESSDGGNSFSKPLLHQFNFRGSTANNLLQPIFNTRNQNYTHINSVFIDPTMPRGSPLRFRGVSGFTSFASHDGLNWTMANKEWDIPRLNNSGGGDTQGVAFWDPPCQCYSFYTRYKFVRPHPPPWYRMVRRARARSIGSGAVFTNESVVMSADELDNNVHEAIAGNITPPVDYYGATPWWSPRGRVYWMAAVRFWHWGLGGAHEVGGGHLAPGTKDIAMTVSRDGKNFEFLGGREPFLRPTMDGTVGSRDLWLAPPGPVRVGDEELYFVTRSNVAEGVLLAIDGSSHAWESEVTVGKMRVDGMVSMDAPYSRAQDAAVLRTRPLVFHGRRLELNVDANGGGSVLIELLDAHTDRLLLTSVPLSASGVHEEVTWVGGSPYQPNNESALSQWAGVPVRMVLHLQECKLYSLTVLKTDDNDNDKSDDLGCPANLLLRNGMCLPSVFPPENRNLTEIQRFPSRFLPPHLTSRPSIISVDFGRQLLAIDDYLIQSSNATQSFYQATVQLEAVITPTEAWEGSRSGAPGSGGVWWDPSRKLFQAIYGCICIDPQVPSSRQQSSICLATSRNGLRWSKDAFEGAMRRCTNCWCIALPRSLWLDLQAPPQERWKLGLSTENPPAPHPPPPPPRGPTAADASATSYRSVGFYIKHFTFGTWVHDIVIDQSVSLGLNSEWNDGTVENGAGQNNTISDGIVRASHCGVYADGGTRNETVAWVRFEQSSWAGVGFFRNTGSSVHDCNLSSGLPAGALNISLGHIPRGLEDDRTLKTDDEAAAEPFPLNKRYGVNVHFTDNTPGVEMLAKAFSTCRMDFDWGTIETKKGVYNFTQWDVQLAQFQAQGIVPMWILDGNDPPSGNPLYDRGKAPFDATGRSAFANFTVAAMLHFKGKGPVIWELWNEPNGGTGWPALPSQPFRGNPLPYAALLEAVGEAMIAAGVDNETLVGPAVSGFDLGFIEGVMKASGLKYLDAVSVHAYRGDGPESVLADWATTRALIRQYLPATRRLTPPLLSGEWGWAACTTSSTTKPAPCHGGAGSGESISEREQASRLVRQRLVNDLAGIRLSIWYDWSNGGDNRTSGGDNYGTVGHDGRTPKLAYTAAVTSFNLLAECQFQSRTTVSRERGSNASTFVLQYSCLNQQRYVAWTNDTASCPSCPEGVNATLILPPGCYSVTDLLGQELGNGSEHCTGSSGLPLTLTRNPVYLILTAVPMSNELLIGEAQQQEELGESSS